MNFYKRHLGDYAKDAGHLSMLEHGAYTLLLDRYYTSEGGIPAGDAYRVTRARAKPEREATDAVLAEFFILEGGVYTNRRAEEELSAWRSQAETNRRIAMDREARKRARQEHESLNDSLQDRATIDQPSQNPESRKEQKHESPNGDSSASASAEAPAGRSDSIPYQAIVDAYNGTMTGLAKVRELTTKRRTLIRSAWQASPQRRSLAFWQAYFAECQDDDFLNGNGPYGNGHANWRPTFDYLLRADVVTRVFEAAMDRMERDA